MHVNTGGFRTLVFKNRGALLVPVALVLLVFGRPSPASAVIGVAIAALGELLRVWAVGYSGVTTRAEIVTAPTLVTNGPYAITRNPLYVANAIVALGVGVYAIIIPLEEAYLAGLYGQEYRRYLEAVPQLMPSGRSMPAAER